MAWDGEEMVVVEEREGFQGRGSVGKCLCEYSLSKSKLGCMDDIPKWFAGNATM